MTVATELAKTAQRLEYILCIEGMGWPVDEADLSQGLQGTVFTTADQESTLASLLGCTVKKGLEPSASISETLDTRKGKYTVGGMTFKIQDNSDYLLENFSPHQSYTEATLNTNLKYGDTTVIINTQEYAAGAVAWLYSREAILLGSKTGSGPWTYTGSTRGYVGTPRGRVVANAADAQNLGWPADLTRIYSRNIIWSGRRVALYMHVPGEADTNLLRAWSGRLSGGPMLADAGNLWEFPCVGDFLGSVNRIRRNPIIKIGTQRTLADEELRQAAEESGNLYDQFRRVIELRMEEIGTSGYSVDIPAIVKASYQYRTEPGGTDQGLLPGMAAPIQALDTSLDEDVNYSLFKVGDRLVRVLKMWPEADTPRANLVETESTATWLGQNDTSDFPEDSGGRFLLDNFRDEWELSRFAVNKQVTRNPIDIMLMFLTTMPGEFFRGDAAGGTATVPTFAASSFVADQFIGAALHCVEGPNKGESRVISANGTASVTVETAFSNAPSAGEEYQIRSSIYDVLPMGWGMGVPWHRIDISSFEDIRQKHLASVEVGRFAVGDQAEFDIWEFIHSNICEPWGIVIFVDKSTGKLTARYLDQPLGSGVDDTYVTVVEKHFMGRPQLDYRMSKPVSRIILNVRAKPWVTTVVASSIHHGEVRDRIEGALLEDADEIPIEILAPELQDGHLSERLDTVKIQGLLHTIDDAGQLIAHLVSRMRMYLRPPPVVSCLWDMALYPEVSIGKYVSMTYSQGVHNPFTGSRGWSGLVGRVISIELPVRAKKPYFKVEVELLSAINAAKIAPAAEVLAKSSDSNGQYLECSLAAYAADGSSRDHYHFVVGDLVDLFDRTGTLKESLGSITGFGTNFVSDPTAGTEASSKIRIYVSDASITSSIATGDYITFKDWSGSNTARMDGFAAYATATSGATPGTLTGGDAAKRYA